MPPQVPAGLAERLEGWWATGDYDVAREVLQRVRRELEVVVDPVRRPDLGP